MQIRKRSKHTAFKEAVSLMEPKDVLEWTIERSHRSSLSTIISKASKETDWILKTHIVGNSLFVVRLR